MLYKEKIVGARRISNFVWAIILGIGGFGFVFSSLECYLKKNIFPFFDTTSLNFIPQGIVMFFYGNVALILMGFIILLMYLDIGGGFNEIDSEKKVIRIIRKGFPGKNKKILLTYNFELIKALEIFIEDGLNPKRNLFLCTKDDRKIPLYSNDQLLSIDLLENNANKISRILNVSIKTNF